MPSISTHRISTGTNAPKKSIATPLNLNGIPEISDTGYGNCIIPLRPRGDYATRRENHQRRMTPSFHFAIPEKKIVEILPTADEGLGSSLQRWISTIQILERTRFEYEKSLCTSSMRKTRPFQSGMDFDDTAPRRLFTTCCTLHFRVRRNTRPT